MSWAEHERTELAAGFCPYSGLLMARQLNAWNEDVFMCGVCDCFGYTPALVGAR